MMNSLNLPENVFVSLSFMEDVFAEYSGLVWQFSFSPLKISFLSFVFYYWY